MKVPLYLVVAQWVALFGLGLLVIIMYRQLGRVFARKSRPENLGPPIGTRALEFDYRDLSGNSIRSFKHGDGRAALVAFVDPTCPACEELVENLGEGAAAGELDGTRVLLVTYEPPDYVHLSDAFSLTQLEIVWPTSDSVRSDYNVNATPLVVAIDGAGIVRGVRPTTQLKDIRPLIRAAEESREESEMTQDEYQTREDGSKTRETALIKSEGGMG